MEQKKNHRARRKKPRRRSSIVKDQAENDDSHVFPGLTRPVEIRRSNIVSADAVATSNSQMTLPPPRIKTLKLPVLERPGRIHTDGPQDPDSIISPKSRFCELARCLMETEALLRLSGLSQPVNVTSAGFATEGVLELARADVLRCLRFVANMRMLVQAADVNLGLAFQYLVRLKHMDTHESNTDTSTFSRTARNRLPVDCGMESALLEALQNSELSREGGGEKALLDLAVQSRRLRQLVRIKVEDLKDIEVLEKALRDTSCFFDAVEEYARQHSISDAAVIRRLHAFDRRDVSYSHGVGLSQINPRSQPLVS
eukprot:Rmarinus@m.7878